MARVALLQIATDASESVAERVERGLAWAREAARDADFVVLPELWNTGAFDIAGCREHAQPIDGPLAVALSSVARDTGTWLHGGSFAERAPDGQYFNTSVVFAPDGTLAARYRKIHLFGFTGGETELMSSGTELVTVDTPLGVTGIATCYDLRFPEMFRGLVDQGATSVVMGSGWPTPRIAHWSILARARAIEDQLLVIACNEVGVHGGATLGGRSVVVDPTGAVLAEGGDGEELVVAEVDVDLAARWRRDFPVLADRRL